MRSLIVCQKKLSPVPVEQGVCGSVERAMTSGWAHFSHLNLWRAGLVALERLDSGSHEWQDGLVCVFVCVCVCVCVCWNLNRMSVGTFPGCAENFKNPSTLQAYRTTKYSSAHPFFDEM